MPLTDPVPSSSFDVLERNIQDTDKFVNQETGTFTNRVGKIVKPIPVIEAEANAAVISLGWSPVGEFSTGFTYTKLNDVGRDSSGSWWRYNGNDLPKVITAGTVPSSPNFSVISFENAYNVEWDSGKTVGYSLDDLQAFTDELYAQSGIVDNGLPDKLGASQRVDAINLLVNSGVSKVASLTFKTVAEMVAGVPGVTYEIGQPLRVQGENGRIANYQVVGSASDVSLGGGLWAKLLDLDVRQPMVCDVDLGEQVLRQKTSFISDSQLGTTKLRLIAHRGMGFTEQNTLSDYGYALALGADGLEIDIKFSSDGVPVLYHDDTVDALTDGTGLIESKTLSQIRALKFKNLVGTTYENERIPLFDDFMRMVKKSGAIVIVEVKSYNKTQTDAVAQIVVDYSMERNVIFASFNMGVLQNYVDYVPGCNIAYYGGSTTGDIDALAAIKFAGAKYVYAQGGAFTQANFRYAIARGVSYISGTTTTTNAYALGKLNGANLTVTDVMGGRII